MKLFLALAATFFCCYSFAQSGNKMNASHKNVIKIGTGTFFNGDEFPFNIAWETKVANRQSIQIGLSPRLYRNGYQTTNGLALSLAYRKYISKGKEGLQGLYFSPIVKYGVLNDKQTYNDYVYNGPSLPATYIEKTDKYKVSTLNLGFLFGKQWVYKSGFSLDISGGIGFYNNNYSGSNPNNNYYYRRNGNEYGITPNVNITVGYAF